MECLLTLITTPQLEERLVDWFLEEGHEGFTAIACHGHGVRAEHLSVREQVAGRQKRVAFWLQVPEVRARAIVASLASEFGDAGIHFWISPVLESGPIVSTSEGTGRDSGRSGEDGRDRLRQPAETPRSRGRSPETDETGRKME